MWHHVKYSDAVEVCIDIRKGVTTFSETVEYVTCVNVDMYTVVCGLSG